MFWGDILSCLFYSSNLLPQFLLHDCKIAVILSCCLVPNVLAEAKVTDSKVFALCYRNGGGIFTLGGVNQQIHAKRTVNYAQLSVKQGWYGVTLVNIRFIDPKTGTVTELPASTKPLFKFETEQAAKNDNKGKQRENNIQYIIMGMRI